MTLYLIGLGLGLLGAIASATVPARFRIIVAATGSCGACALTLISAIGILSNGHHETFHSQAVLPLTGISLSLDALGSLFIATAAVVGFSASVYFVGYASHDHHHGASTTAMMFALFVTSLLFVPSAASVTTFMVSWELMALFPMFLLLAGQRERKSAREALQWYAVMTHVGTAAILIGLVILATHAGGQSFATIHAHASSVSPAIRSLAFLLVLAGFASKAGAVPLHVWLPRAHPEAPSPTSALMSGAMVNLGIYGIIRIGDSLLNGGALWWWVVVITLGILSALYGALHASASADLKRLLAYSTIDNVGLVLIGVGVSGALYVSGHRIVGALSMFAALFHLLNHSLFKGCLFLGAGAVERSTGTRDLDQLGGLARRLPALATLFGIGALSISALPGFNGFASEWLLLESLLHGFVTHSTPTLVVLFAGVAALALTGGLTAAAFVKAVGIGFLGQPRSAGAASPRKVAPSMLAGMGLLAAPCLLVGLLPGLLEPALTRASAVLPGLSSRVAVRSGIELDLGTLRGIIEPAFLVIGLLGTMLVINAGIRVFSRRGVRNAVAWGCGRELQTARMQYTATSYAEPLGRVFVDVLRPHQDVEVTHVRESRYFAQAIRYQRRDDDGIERFAYHPLIALVGAWGAVARHAQNGSVHRYLAYGFVALVVILVAFT
jgi:formate hydrogenlyase subunit 3/multisubunit Na+/H+ antiporter MnhD subunit